MTNKLRSAIFLLFFILLAGYLSYSILSNKPLGIEVGRDEADRYYVVSCTPGFWGEEHLLPGDMITGINGKEPGQYFTIKRYGYYVEQASSIQFIRTDSAGHPQTMNADVGKGIEPELLVVHFVLPLGALMLLAAFSVLVHKRKKHDQAANYLILFFLSTGLAYLSAFSSGRLDFIGGLTLNAAFSLVPFFFIKFMDKYLERFGEQFASRRLLTAFGCFIVLLMMFDQGRMVTGYHSIYQYVSPLLLFYFVIANIIIVYKLLGKFLRHRHDRLRSLFKLTLIGHVVAFLPFVLLYAVPQLFGAALVPSEMAAIFLFAIPVVYLYMFTTRQLFDVDFLLSRILYYVVIAFFPTLLITGLAGVLMRREDYSWVHWVQTFLTVYLLLTLFLFGKEFTDLRLRPKFNKDLYNFQGSLDRFSKRISRVMKRSDLEQVLEQEIVSVLPVKEVAFLELNRESEPGAEVRLTANGSPPQSVMDALKAPGCRLMIGETTAVPQGMCVVIGHKRSTCHILWLDDKENQTKYNLDELGWLRTLANYSAIVYENLHLIESLLEDLETEIRKQKGASPWVLRLIFNLSENERRRLAADLHDSALQDQLIWFRRLEAVMQDHAMSPELRGELDTIREGLLDVIHQIRETCNELRPPLLKEMGIIEALERLFEEAQMRSNYAIDFRVKPLARELNDEQILAIYRIVQELLRNAGKHAKAKSILIELEQQDSIRLHYKDDGVGMELTGFTDSFRHMGLSGMKERVRSLEGEFSVRSQVGGGFEVLIELPLEMADYRGHVNEGGGSNDSDLVG